MAKAGFQPADLGERTVEQGLDRGREIRLGIKARRNISERLGEELVMAAMGAVDLAPPGRSPTMEPAAPPSWPMEK